jgi:hypothetical protein
MPHLRVPRAPATAARPPGGPGTCGRACPARQPRPLQWSPRAGKPPQRRAAGAAWQPKWPPTGPAPYRSAVARKRGASAEVAQEAPGGPGSAPHHPHRGCLTSTAAAKPGPRKCRSRCRRHLRRCSQAPRPTPAQGISETSPSMPSRHGKHELAIERTNPHGGRVFRQAVPEHSKPRCGWADRVI